MKKALLITLSTLTLLANPYETNKEELASVVKTGQEASTTLLKTLGKNLKSEMKRGGPMAAVKFCSTKAYALTASVDKKFGKDISIKRISLKERNPDNKAQGQEHAILTAMDTMQKNGVILPEYFVERINKDTYKYYRPLTINKQVCLKCHGDVAKNEKLATYLDVTYPHDKATGYNLGDLRGAVVITIKK